MTAKRKPAQGAPSTAAKARPRGPGGRFLAAGQTAQEPAATSDPAGDTADLPAQPSGTLDLLIVRHADAGDPATWPGDDAERPLSKKGRRQAKRLGDLLDELGIRPDVVLTSPKVRAADTAQLIGRRVGRKPTVDYRLEGGFDPDGLAGLVADLDPGVARVMLVGHDPDFSSLASWLVGAPLSLPKGALARIELPERAVGDGRGILRWLVPPNAVAG